MNLKVVCVLVFFIVFFSCKSSENNKNPIVVDDGIRTIVILGSSTAEGHGATPDSAWVNRIARCYKDYRVINLAYGGLTTYEILPSNVNHKKGRPSVNPERNITKALSYDPEIIILSMTNNDVGYGYWVEKEYVKNLKYIRDYAKLHGVDTFLVTTTFARTITPYDSLKLASDLIINEFKKYSINIFDTLCDKRKRVNYTVFQAPDGGHLNNKGHNAVYFKVHEKLDSLFRKSKK
jgi:hypothetical protein